MAEVLQLLTESWGFVAQGSLPPQDVIKMLISKVKGTARAAVGG